MDRSKSSVKAWAAFLIGAPLLITAFQNCAQMFETPVFDMDASGSSLSGNISFSGGCEADLMNLYQQTYFPFLKQQCGSCHTNGPGIGQFGHMDFNTSYNAFKSITRAAVNRNAVNAAHQPPFTGPQNQSAIDSFSAPWTAAEATYATCTGGVVEGDGLPTLSKANTAIIAAAGNPNTWTTLSYNLASEMKDTTLANKIPLTATIEVRVATINGVRQGYEFRNPSLRLNTGITGPYRVSGIALVINGTTISNITTYKNVDFSINSTTSVNVAPGSGYALAVMTPAATDTFALQFSSIKNTDGGNISGGTGGGGTPTPTLPTSVTLAQLLGNDATLGIFRQSCVSCHSAGNAQGGLDITNAAQAKLQANNIYARMNNVNNPMPRAGLLVFEKRELVRIWIASGAN